MANDQVILSIICHCRLPPHHFPGARIQWLFSASVAPRCTGLTNTGKWSTYQERRNQGLLTLAATTGKPICITDPAPLHGGALQTVQALPGSHIDIIGMDGESDPQTCTARDLTQRYLMDVADCTTAGVVGLAEILRMLMHGALALIEISGLDPMELAMDQGFIEA